jgi:hypothetical protein
MLRFAPVLNEHGLWLAVVWQAAADLTGKDERVSASARRWFESKNNGPGSFLWICDHFALDAGWLRSRLLDTSAHGISVAASLE